MRAKRLDTGDIAFVRDDGSEYDLGDVCPEEDIEWARQTLDEVTAELVDEVRKHTGSLPRPVEDRLAALECVERYGEEAKTEYYAATCPECERLRADRETARKAVMQACRERDDARAALRVYVENDDCDCLDCDEDVVCDQPGCRRCTARLCLPGVIETWEVKG